MTEIEKKPMKREEWEKIFAEEDAKIDKMYAEEGLTMNQRFDIVMLTIFGIGVLSYAFGATIGGSMMASAAAVMWTSIRVMIWIFSGRA